MYIVTSRKSRREFSRIQFSKNSPDSAWKIRWLSWTTMLTWFWHVPFCRYCGLLWRTFLSFLCRADVLHSTMNSHSDRLQFDCCPASVHRERRESQAVDVKLRWVREIWCRRDIDRLRACDRFVLPCRPGIWWKVFKLHLNLLCLALDSPLDAKCERCRDRSL